MDQFTPGVRCRQLPCDHVFHSTCIARWLIERSAVCPLCKLDLYEEEEEVVVEEENNDDARPSSPEASSSSQSFFSWWSGFSRRREESSTITSRQIEIPSGNQQPTEERTALIAETHNITTITGQMNHNNRSWWPFSVQSGIINTDGGMNVDEDDNGNMHRSSSSSGFRGGWTTMNLFGRIRSREHRRTLTDNDMSTELTEPLVSEDLLVEQQQQQEQQPTEVDPSTDRNETNLLIHTATSTEI